MKTIEEMFEEINASEELRKAISEIRDRSSMTDFLKKHECEATAEDFEKYVKTRTEGEVGDDEAASVAAGALHYIGYLN